MRIWLCALLLAGACGGEVTRADSDFGPLCAFAPTIPPPVSLSRLRSWEYRNSAIELLELSADTPVELRSDLVRAQFTAISAASDCYDDVGHETREHIAQELAAQAFRQSPTPLDRVGCAPQSVEDPCLSDFLESFGRRAWRRALDLGERATYRRLL